MAVKIDGKVYRNLQEQVLANTRNIESLIGTNDNHAAKAIYVHKISWAYTSSSPNIYLSYLSTKSTPYSSMADIFSHRIDTDLTTSEIVEYGDGHSADTVPPPHFILLKSNIIRPSYAKHILPFLPCIARGGSMFSPRNPRAGR